MITPREILAIAELIYFVTALVLALMVSWRHGFSKQLGWFSLIMLSIFCIGADSTVIAAAIKPGSGVIVAWIVFESFGLVSILVALQGYLSRISAGIALAIVGICYLCDTNEGKDAQGRTIQRAGVCIFLGIFACLALITVHMGINRDLVSSTENPLLVATAISLPLLAVRFVFPILVAYDVDPTVFSLLSPARMAVVAQAMMVSIEEFIVVAVFLTAGF